MIAVYVVSMLALIVSSALACHEHTAEKIAETIEELEEEAAWHLSVCPACIIDTEADPYSEEP